MEIQNYILPLEQSFKANSNIDNAAAMSKYMRNKFQYHGIKSPLRKELTRNFLKSSGLPSDKIKIKLIKYLWDLPQREYQYVAMEILGKTARKDDNNIIELYEIMVLNKSWWDTVDYIAATLMGTYFYNNPKKIQSKTSKWMNSQNIWLQRCCLLFQLKYHDNLNTELLEKFIPRFSKSKEFFIQKAIGWILREYSKTNPQYVINFVDDNNLAALSNTEALLWMKKHNKLNISNY